MKLARSTGERREDNQELSGAQRQKVRDMSTVLERLGGASDLVSSASWAVKHYLFRTNLPGEIESHRRILADRASHDGSRRSPDRAACMAAVEVFNFILALHKTPSEQRPAAVIASDVAAAEARYSEALDRFDKAALATLDGPTLRRPRGM